ncbi:hypothetical protein CC1G_05526 [Coprinopsis cinerea okayama7|uniref:Uncharacterized protein n=1 Tax=Coprinopsis cinerea (strain Okayama-7 / 130 / ATCC MYA-4618 / FGSC 9003) TaxID=240176 RepID=A8P5L8_COPC7|nr:hypothetical protein CC1G_05526 [Coprinopsis cinerea okayama7\|eukprot:XP_001838973.1 hypothetical protein CC1G_05526 [Coprinopsis cinerea okayama7\
MAPRNDVGDGGAAGSSAGHDASPLASAAINRPPISHRHRREWYTLCEQNPWAPAGGQEGFKHAGHVLTVMEKQAKRLDGISPMLKKEELETLPHEWRLEGSKSGHLMKLFNVDDVRELIVRRCDFFKVPVPPHQPIFPIPASGQDTQPSIAAVFAPSAQPADDVRNDDAVDGARAPPHGA